MDRESTFGIIYEAEVLSSLFDCNYVHKSGGIRYVGANFAIDFDEALHDNCFCFTGVESILQTVWRERTSTILQWVWLEIKRNLD